MTERQPESSPEAASQWIPADPVPVPAADGPATAPRQVHALTPLVEAMPLIPGIALATLFINGGALWTSGVLGIPPALLLTTVGFLSWALYRYLAWRRLTFWFDGVGDLRIDSGVLYRNERKVQLTRLQAVDVEQPLIARLVGLTSVKIEVAGAGDSRVNVAYLSNTDAVQLRRELLSRAARDSDDTPVPAETLIAEVTTSDLIVSLLLRSATAGLLLLTAGLVVIIFLTQGAVGVLLLPVSGGIPAVIVLSEFSALYGFTVAKSTDGVRLRHGLFKTQAQTVPHGRLAAIDIVEPLLWRRRGWVRIRLTVAGVAGSSDSDDQSAVSKTVLLPVATRDVARQVLGQVLPGVDIESIPLVPAPRRARWRAPIQWSRLAVGHDDSVFVARRGWVTRHLAIVPHARTQSVSIRQGPYQRRLGLSSLRVDIAPGPVTVSALYFPTDVTRTNALAQVTRAQLARQGDWSS
ncbi:MAG: PH domain-containing protein [Candidatus Nanopelagicales bacterium]